MDYKGYHIEVKQDTADTSPREDMDNFGTMVCFHSRYKLGDEHNIVHTDFTSWDMMKGFIEKQNEGCMVVPIYMYDHSGITINTTGFSCPWDSGQIGFIYATKEQIQEEFGGDRLKAVGLLKSEVEVYDMYLRGEIYYFSITDENNEDVDGCGGIYGYDEAEAEAKGIVDALVKEHGEQLAMEI